MRGRQQRWGENEMMRLDCFPWLLIHKDNMRGSAVHSCLRQLVGLELVIYVL